MIDIHFIRRAVCTLLVLCVASTLAADSYPNITKSHVVSLDAKTIEADANNGTPFELVLGETKVTVALLPSPVWPEEGLTLHEIGKDGSVAKRVVQGNITYAGDVLGEDPAASEARFTIARGVLEGYVLSDTGWWFIEPLSRFEPKAGPEEYLVYAAHDTDFAAEYPDDGTKGDRIYDPPVFADPRIRVALVADKEYLDQRGPGGEWLDSWATLVNSLSGIYKDQFGREIISRNGIVDLYGTFLTSTDPATLLAQLDQSVAIVGGLSALESQIAHLTTGKEMNGNVYGKGHRPGDTGWTQQSTTLAFRNMILAAHVIGLNFGARHDNADRWCAVPGSLFCPFYRQTIMWPAFTNGAVPRYSDGTRDPDHDNAALICQQLALRNLPCQQ